MGMSIASQHRLMIISPEFKQFISKKYVYKAISYSWFIIFTVYISLKIAFNKSMNNSLKKILIRINHHGILSTISYLLVTVILNKIGVEINAVYRAPKTLGAETKPSNFSFFQDFNKISEDDKILIEIEYGIAYIKKLKRKLNHKEVFVIGYIDNKIASTFWIKYVENEKKLPFQTYYLLCGDYTQPEYRGQGLQRKSIDFRKHMIFQHLCSTLPIIIESSVTNHASLSNIEKCNFNKVGVYISYNEKLLYSNFHI